jgi:hypothetical protein
MVIPGLRQWFLHVFAQTNISKTWFSELQLLPFFQSQESFEDAIGWLKEWACSRGRLNGAETNGLIFGN